MIRRRHFRGFFVSGKRRTPPHRQYRGRLGLALIGLPVFLASLAGCAQSSTDERSGRGSILGSMPSYESAASVARIPNAAAVGTRIWVPALDTGYDPQGLAVAQGSLLVSGYTSDSLQKHSGACRIFRIAPDSGQELGNFDIPAPCRHAGGIAYGGDGTVYVSDTHTLFVFSFDGAFKSGSPDIRSFPLDPSFDGALAAADQTSLWIGTYKENGPGRIFRFPFATLRGLKKGDAVTPGLAAATFEIPPYAQGAAIDPDGKRLWVSGSNIAFSGSWGELYALDIATGRSIATYPAAAGIEGLDFDASGKLWGVSEAGTRHFYDHSFFNLVMPFNPLILEIDTSKLKEK